ncbi:MAG: hypothetical protein ABIJ53_04235 [Verrucomicrobiota bacterium]
MYRLINERIKDITKAFADPMRSGALEEYNWLCTALRDRNVSISGDYHRRFRAFWRMRCGGEYGHAFFTLLERGKSLSELDPVSVARELYEYPTRGGRKTLEFSFATKLAHIVNLHLPIYDSMVSKFYFFIPPDSINIDERLAHCGHNFTFLRTEYARVIDEGLLAPAIRAFRKALPAAAGHTDEKVIDWLIWQFVDIAYRKDWFPSGLCRHL